MSKDCKDCKATQEVAMIVGRIRGLYMIQCSTCECLHGFDAKKFDELELAKKKSKVKICKRS